MTACPSQTFNLDRFVAAQSGVYAQALAELKAGKKRSHWMWFVLPQLRALGMSAMAQRYGIESPDEAQAYAAHPVLGVRLRECVRALLGHKLTAEDMLGEVDAMKLRSCLTLFIAAVPGERLFAEALERFYGGQPDEATLRLLRVQPGSTDRSR